MHKVQWLKLIYYEVSFFVRITQLTFLSCFWYLIIIILIIILYWSNTKMENLRFNHGSVASPKLLFVNQCTITSPMQYAVLHRMQLHRCMFLDATFRWRVHVPLLRYETCRNGQLPKIHARVPTNESGNCNWTKWMKGWLKDKNIN